MFPIKQSTALTIPFFCHDADGDAVTGLSDGDFTKRISQGSGAFAAMTVTITEMENGWYSIPLSTSHSNTLGILTIVFTHASIKQVNLQFRVHARLPDDLAHPTVSGRSFDVTSAGLIGIDLDNTVGSLAAGSEITGLNDPTAAAVADAVWDEAKAGHTAAGSFGEEVQAHSLSTEITALNDPTAAAVADAVWDEAIAGHVAGGSFGEEVQSHSTFDNTADQVIVTTNNDKTGYTLSATGVDDVLDEVVEGTITLRQAVNLFLSVLTGKSSGGGTATLVFRDTADSKNRLSVTVDANGNRTAVGTRDGA